MDYNFLEKSFPQLSFFPNQGIILDELNKKIYVFLFIETIDTKKDDYKNELIKISHENYQVIGIIVTNSISVTVEINVLPNEYLLIIINNVSYITNIIQKISCQKIDKKLLKIKESIKENLLYINSLIYKNLEKEIHNSCSEDKEMFYKEIVFGEKINRKKLIENYPQYKNEITDLQKTISEAKKYFREKK